MEIKHREMTPSVRPDAYVAPTAVLSGQVSAGTVMLARARQDDE
jgi:carbonic anhydrase/acetyltransferase-like protein (isoleucine patch superfamily)